MKKGNIDGKCCDNILERDVISGGECFFKYNSYHKIIGKFRGSPSLHLAQRLSRFSMSFCKVAKVPGILE